MRFGELIKNDKYTIATNLDSRYKSTLFNGITVMEQIESVILNLRMTIRTRGIGTQLKMIRVTSSSKRSRMRNGNEDQRSTSCAQS